MNADGYDDVLVSALQSDYVCADCGVAYVYLGTASGLSSSFHVRLTYPGSDGGLAVFGNSVSGGGDVNGDGFGDIVVGSPMDDGGGADRGTIYLYRGSTAGILNLASATLSYSQTDDVALFGWSVDITGDYNGDGFSDLVCGAKSADVDPMAADDRGLVYIYSGSATGTASTPSTTLASPRNEPADFGALVVNANDVNGDGIDDLALAASAADLTSNASGAVFIYHGAKAGLPITPQVSLAYTASDTSSHLGSGLSGLGDANGDGICDLAAGASGADISGTDRGYAYVFSGSSEGLLQNSRANLAYPGSDNSASFGACLQ